MSTVEAQRAARRAWNERNPEYVKEDRRRWKRTLVGKRMRKHTFLAIDGEGWTTDGRHGYHMIVTSLPNVYVTSPTPLTSEESLAFIASLPHQDHRYNVSFFFDYDVTMILRDMAVTAPDKARALFEPGRRSYVWWNGYGLAYRPHKSFTVKRWTDDNSSQPVTIHDGQGFFQCSFVKALEKFGVSDKETRDRIAAMKDQRAVFTADDMADILHYSQEECRLLVSLMEKVRDLSEQAELNADPYEGPGGLADRALRRFYGKDRHTKTLDTMPSDVHDCASAAMYGGRFEPLAVGPVPLVVREYDKHSAYPAAMSQLPCLIHGRWSRTRKQRGLINLSHIRFRDDREPDYGLCYALPIRKKTGELHYPREGSGFYWHSEFQDVSTLDVTVDCTWSWMPGNCKCRPFAWIRGLFHQRETMEAANPGSGIALKLALNTLYGKCAQTRPRPGTWLNFVYASLITSSLRTEMYRLYTQLPPRTALMFATDAIFTTAELETSHGLGGLELANTYNDLTIVQAGLYFDGDSAHFKTRGIPKKYVADEGSGIRLAALQGVEYPITVKSFRGLRIGLQSSDPATIGQWMTQPRTIETRTNAKRSGEWVDDDGIIWTRPTENINRGGESMRREFATTVSFLRALEDMNSDDETEWMDDE